MDYGIWNGLGITALAIFGLWAFLKGEKIAARSNKENKINEDKKK